MVKVCCLPNSWEKNREKKTWWNPAKISINRWESIQLHAIQEEFERKKSRRKTSAKTISQRDSADGFVLRNPIGDSPTHLAHWFSQQIAADCENEPQMAQWTCNCAFLFKPGRNIYAGPIKILTCTSSLLVANMVTKRRTFIENENNKKVLVMLPKTLNINS